MNSMSRARESANANVYLPLLNGGSLETVLQVALSRAVRATAATIPARAAKPTVACKPTRKRSTRIDAYEPATRPTAKELATARKVLGDVEAHYLTKGFAEVRGGGYQLTRLGEIAFACARLIEGKPGYGQPRPVRGNPMFWLRDGGYIAKAGRQWDSGWRLTRKGRAIVAALGLAPKAPAASTTEDA